MASSTSNGGGVDRVTLSPRNSGGLVPPFVEIEVVRGRSSYSQTMSTSEGMPIYTHTLVVATPLDYDIFECERLENPLTQGVIAQVRLTSGRSIILGWDDEDQPLRLIASTADSAMLSTTSSQVSTSPSPLKYWTLRAYSTEAVV